MDVDQNALLAVTERIAREAGAGLLRFAADRGAVQGGGLPGTTTKSTPTDLVSEADLATERLIRERILAARPDDAILGEEGDDHPGTSGLRWVVDPLDGTVNFLFGVPQWCVSIAVEDLHGALAGVIYDPNRDQLWAATRDGEATVDGEVLRGSGTTDLGQALVATGFGYDATVRAAQADVIARMLPQVRDVRRMGAAALDLAWTAAGRYDVYVERGIKPWDVAAGMLICARAGLAVERLDALPPQGAGVLVAPAALVPALREIVG